MDMAMRVGAPVIGLNDSGGARYTFMFWFILCVWLSNVGCCRQALQLSIIPHKETQLNRCVSPSTVLHSFYSLCCTSPFQSQNPGGCWQSRWLRWRLPEERRGLGCGTSVESDHGPLCGWSCVQSCYDWFHLHGSLFVFLCLFLFLTLFSSIFSVLVLLCNEVWSLIWQPSLLTYTRVLCCSLFSFISLLSSFYSCFFAAGEAHILHVRDGP